MPCTAFASNLSARDRARFLHDTIPPDLFRTGDSGDRVPWRISPEPFPLSPATAAVIKRLGDDLLAFYRALNALYLRSARGTAPAFVAEYLDRGKPEQIVKLARQNRFKNDLPCVIRPDLILTSDGFVATELDSVPGGMGFTGAMMHAYCKLGDESVGGADGIERGFAAMARTRTQLEHPVVAIVVSEESADYRNELRWLATAATATDTIDAYVCAPDDVVFTEEALFLRTPDGRERKIDLLYRNFELFDLANVPKHELMLYAARHRRVVMTPPPKAHLEEKLSFALLHHPHLEAFWRAELGSGVYESLRRLFPKTWVLDPRPLPPQAVIWDLFAGNVPVSDWRALATLGKSERAFVVKPSGFSPLAWGSRGVRVADDLTRDEWAAALDEALRAFDITPYILQRFHKGTRVRQQSYDPQRDEVRTFEGRVRLCPFYFVVGDRTQLGGILATIAPADKRVIHGMQDAVMTSCIVRDTPSAESERP
jgi:hypothetical protein